MIYRHGKSSREEKFSLQSITPLFCLFNFNETYIIYGMRRTKGWIRSRFVHSKTTLIDVSMSRTTNAHFSYEICISNIQMKTGANRFPRLKFHHCDSRGTFTHRNLEVKPENNTKRNEKQPRKSVKSFSTVTELNYFPLQINKCVIYVCIGGKKLRVACVTLALFSFFWSAFGRFNIVVQDLLVRLTRFLLVFSTGRSK